MCRPRPALAHDRRPATSCGDDGTVSAMLRDMACHVKHSPDRGGDERPEWSVRATSAHAEGGGVGDGGVSVRIVEGGRCEPR